MKFSNKKNLQTKQNGFNLTELLITITVIGILASAAMPAYDDYIRRGYSEDAKGQITEMLFSQEQHFVENQEYAKTLTDIGAPAQIVRNGTVIYTFSLKGCGSGGATDYSECVEVTATASGGQTSYGNLRATSLGERKFVGGKHNGEDW